MQNRSQKDPSEMMDKRITEKIIYKNKLKRKNNFFI